MVVAGESGLIFPKEVIWLAGAPGAGKGTMASSIAAARQLPGVIEVSSLLQAYVSCSGAVVFVS